MMQTTKWISLDVQPQESDVPARWLLLEKETGWKDQSRRPYEIEGERCGGKQLINNTMGDKIIDI